MQRKRGANARREGQMQGKGVTKAKQVVRPTLFLKCKGRAKW